MASLAALLERAPDIARALETRDMMRAIELIQQRFPRADVRTVLDKWALVDSLRAANVLFGNGDLEAALMRLGRNDAPAALCGWDCAGRIDVQQMRSVLLHVWQMAEYPCRVLPRRTWLEWFERVGFVSDGAPEPSEPVEAWRAQVGRSIGLAWSRDQERAGWFHKRNLERGWQARLLHVVAPPTAVLGILDEGRGEQEVILHPHRLPRRRAASVAG